MRALIVGASMLLSSTAMAESINGNIDGNLMLKICGLPEMGTFMTGYVAAYVELSRKDMTIMAKEVSKRLDAGETNFDEHFQSYYVNQSCVPGDVTRKQSVDLFCKYLDNHPETRQKDAVDLLADALHEVWPCGK